MQTAYQPDGENGWADVLSRSPVLPYTAGEVDLDPRVTQVVATDNSTISDLLVADPLLETEHHDFHLKQRKGAKLMPMCEYLENGILPDYNKEVKKITTQSICFQIIDQVLYFVDPWRQTVEE